MSRYLAIASIVIEAIDGQAIDGSSDVQVKQWTGQVMDGSSDGWVK